jgi:hypothetical protein
MKIEIYNPITWAAVVTKAVLCPKCGSPCCENSFNKKVELEEFHPWKEISKKEIFMFGRIWSKYQYLFTSICLVKKEVVDGHGFLPILGKSRKVFIYKNDRGHIIWALSPDYWPDDQSAPQVIFAGGKIPQPISEVRFGWERSYSDKKFLLSFGETRDNFLMEVGKRGKIYLRFPTRKVEKRVWKALRENHGSNNLGKYFDPRLLNLRNLMSLGVEVSHAPKSPKKEVKGFLAKIREKINKPRLTGWYIREDKDGYDRPELREILADIKKEAFWRLH